MGLFDSFKRQSNRNLENATEQEIPTPEQNDNENEAAITVEHASSNSSTHPKSDMPSDADSQIHTEDVSRETSSPMNDEAHQQVSDIYVATPLRSYADKKPVKHVIGTTKVIAILNQKGGVGKSTTAIDLGAALGELGKQVLLIDLDPQGNTSSGLGIEKNRLDQCIYDVLLGEASLTDVIIPDVCEGLDVAPATINLAGAEVELVAEMARENRLKEATGAIRGKYDYVFIDCPPSLGLLTINALVAADKLLIPIQCEFYALEGVTKLLDSMKRVKTHLNPSLDIYGVLLTMYDGRTTLSKQVASEVRNFFTRKVFDVVIPRSVKISEAPSFGQPITIYDPNGKGAEAYRALAKEVIARG